MCGIFGYSGQKRNAAEIVSQGLKRLDYRGYDSWGVAVSSEHGIAIEKQVGKISDIADLSLPASSVGIAHTRWATTGAVTQINAHPHYSTDKSFAVAQNGIVENYETLKNRLIKKGYTFISQTDTEVIVRLIEDTLKSTKDLKSAILAAFLELEGRNTIIVITKDKEIFAARNGSPLVIGLNPQEKEVFLSSDTLSFAPYAKKVIVVDNGQLVHVNGNISLFNIRTGNKVDYVIEDIAITANTVDKNGFDHFMMKEIHEAPFIIERLLEQDSKKYLEFTKAIKQAKNVYTIGSGTAGAAAAQIAFYLRHFAHIKVTSLIGADAKEYYDLFTKDDLLIAPSQSGETADVLEVLEYAKGKRVKIASFVNMQGSIMTRMSDFPFMAEAGPEICVMSTKVFVSQIAWGYLVAQTVAGKNALAKKNLKILALAMEQYLANKRNEDMIQTLAKRLLSSKDIFLLGKFQNFQIIREGMVKIIEASYKHAHAIPSGDLKHYAITLVEKDVPVILAVSNDEVKIDLITAANEVRLRGAYVIGIASQKSESFDYYLPVPDTGETSAMMNLIPLQLLAYYMAVELGNNVDKPRNIAKSVTVK